MPESKTSQSVEESHDLQRSHKARRSSAVTLADVAAQAGVSKVAASVVLNNSRSGTRVSSATRERIMSAAESLHYRPNTIARWLRQTSTDVLAFHNLQNTSFDLTFPFFGALLEGVQKGCEEQNKDLLVHGRLVGRSDDDIFQNLLNGHVDGLVLYTHSTTPLIERIIEAGLPIVSVGEAVDGIPFVGIDEEAGGRLMAQHLAQKGHRRILYRLGNSALPPSLQIRSGSFRAEAEALGLEILCSDGDGDFASPTEQSLLLSGPERRPDAIACWNDYSADGITRFCLSHGLRIPQDVALISFDGLAPMHRPALLLTTIAAPWHEVGRTAVNMLIGMHKGQAVPPRTILPVQLALGDTT